jgi:hypothetical protein
LELQRRREEFMAKPRRPKKIVEEFLADLASDPKKFGRFILDPWRYLGKLQKQYPKKYPKSIWERIFRAVAHEVLDDLLNAAESYQH